MARLHTQSSPAYLLPAGNSAHYEQTLSEIVRDHDHVTMFRDEAGRDPARPAARPRVEGEADRIRGRISLATVQLAAAETGADSEVKG